MDAVEYQVEGNGGLKDKLLIGRRRKEIMYASVSFCSDFCKIVIR